MDAKTKRALIGSLKKWEEIIEGKRNDNGWRDCPLCGLFFDDGCSGCPVSEKAGRRQCLGTPYTDWDNANREEQTELVGEVYLVMGVIGPKTMAAAIAEHAFLESLLEE